MSSLFKRVLALFFLGVSSTLFASENSFLKQVESSASQIETLLPQVRAKPEDLSLRPRWHLPHTIPPMEQLLHSPLQASVHLASWSARVMEFDALSDFMNFSSELFSSTTLSPSPSPLIKDSPSLASLPLELRDSVSRIVSAIKTASPLLRSSYELLSEAEQEEILSLHEFAGIRLFTPRQKRKIFQAMEKFNQDALLTAGTILLKTLDKEIPVLKKISESIQSPLAPHSPFKKGVDANTPSRLNRDTPLPKGNLQTGYVEGELKGVRDGQVRIKTDIGKILISGKNDDIYNAESLKEVVLLIDFGGKNSYESSVAGAKKGEIKIAIDFGDAVTIRSTEPVSAGAGVFGIGLLFLMNPSGLNSLHTASYSQGTGICGLGGLFSKGSGDFTAARYAQGAGVFGVGIFDAWDAHRSTFTAHKYAQGVGFTRALGIFRAKTSGSVFKAGLVDPDPREPLGMTSLCQGVGFGLRGFAGGGIGICAISGNQNSIESSYFAQGTGYWRGAGTFFLRGASNIVQARRYAQGSGVHSAIGSFFLKGNQNIVNNWGVGPAYGWDTGIGWAVVIGNENSIQAEWGTGTANLNKSRSFSFISGDGNRLKLPSFGNAFYARDFTDYALHIIQGKENQFFHNHFENNAKIHQNIFVSPWGIIQFGSAALTKKIEPPNPTPEWQKFSQGSLLKSNFNLMDELKSALALSGKEKLEKLLQVASIFGGEKNITREALAHLIASPPSDLPYILEILDPADVDGFIQVRAAVGILSDLISQPLLAAIVKESGEKRVVLISLLALLRAKIAHSALIATLEDKDWRVQAAAARTTGLLLNADRGTIAGRVEILKTIQLYLKSSFHRKKVSEELLRQLSSRPFAESVSILTILRNWSLEERLLFLENAPDDLNSTFDKAKLEKILPILRKHKKEIIKILQQEIEDCRLASESIRKKIIPLLDSPHLNPPPLAGGGAEGGKSGDREGGLKIPEGLTHALIVTLGNIGNARDAELLSGYLTHSSALVRDGASASLGRIGAGSLDLLKKRFADPFKMEDPLRMGEGNAEEKIQVLLSCMATSDASLLTILRKAVEDRQPKVRKVALSILNHLQTPLQKEGEKLKKNLAKKIQEEDRIQQLYLWK